MSTTEKWLLWLATFIATSNVSFMLAQIVVQPKFELIVPVFFIQFFPFQVTILLVLQCLLADSFAWAIAQLARTHYKVSFVIMLLFCTSIASTSLFNIQWILLGSIQYNLFYLPAFIAVSIISLSISLFFIDHHWRLIENHTFDTMYYAVHWQVIIFIVIESLLLFKPVLL